MNNTMEFTLLFLKHTVHNDRSGNIFPEYMLQDSGFNCTHIIVFI